MRHLKEKNKWESSGKLDSIGLDVKGLKTGQRNELVVPGQNIAFSSKPIRMSATFCSLFWIKLEHV